MDIEPITLFELTYIPIIKGTTIRTVTIEVVAKDKYAAMDIVDNELKLFMDGDFFTVKIRSLQGFKQVIP